MDVLAQTSMGAYLATSFAATDPDSLTTDLCTSRINVDQRTWPHPGMYAGDITVELYDRHAPRTCENFIGLARRRYYDGTKIHRCDSLHMDRSSETAFRPCVQRLHSISVRAFLC